jgi:hypothetical protein
MARKYSRKNISRKSKRNNRKRSVKNMRGGMWGSKIKEGRHVTINKDKLEKEILIIGAHFQIFKDTLKEYNKIKTKIDEEKSLELYIQSIDYNKTTLTKGTTSDALSSEDPYELNKDYLAKIID